MASIQHPILLDPYPVTPDIYILPSYLPVPGAGVLPVNAFLMLGAEPVLVDTGLAALKADFMQALTSLINPQDLRWIWLTHTDPDHLGNLVDVLAVAPHARVITTFLGMGKLGLQQIPVDRVYLLNPGQQLKICDRTLLALKPPSYDAPETTGLFDAKSGVLLSSDCFGAILQQPAETALEIAPAALREGLISWAMVDAPWLSMISEVAFAQVLYPIRQLPVEIVLSSHLPPAPQMLPTLLNDLQSARLATPSDGPDQQALEQMMSQALAA